MPLHALALDKAKQAGSHVLPCASDPPKLGKLAKLLGKQQGEERFLPLFFLHSFKTHYSLQRMYSMHDV